MSTGLIIPSYDSTGILLLPSTGGATGGGGIPPTPPASASIAGIQTAEAWGAPVITNPVVPPAKSPFDWWDPDLSTFQDTGTTPAIANNDPVRQINSQTGTGHNLLNTGSTVRPLLKTGALNGHSGVLFDGVNDYIQATAIPLTTDISLIMAINQVTWGNLRTIFCDTTNAQPNLTQLTPTPNIDLFPMIGAAAVVTGATLGTWVILSARWQRSGSISLRVNLGTRATQTGATNSAMTGVLLGCFLGLGNFVNIELGRVALYNSFLSDADETIATQSFGTYYGLF